MQLTRHLSPFLEPHSVIYELGGSLRCFPKNQGNELTGFRWGHLLEFGSSWRRTHPSSAWVALQRTLLREIKAAVKGLELSSRLAAKHAGDYRSLSRLLFVIAEANTQQEEAYMT